MHTIAHRMPVSVHSYVHVMQFPHPYSSRAYGGGSAQTTTMTRRTGVISGGIQSRGMHNRAPPLSPPPPPWWCISAGPAFRRLQFQIGAHARALCFALSPRRGTTTAGVSMNVLIRQVLTIRVCSCFLLLLSSVRRCAVRTYPIKITSRW